jgi:L-gulonate 3-dehydrogenase
MAELAKVAVVATGVIGRSWIRVFARGGCETRVWDPNPTSLEAAIAWHRDEVRQELEQGLNGGVEGCVVPCASLREALAGATYVQESGPEKLDVKREIFRTLDKLASRDAILASSVSTMDMTEIAAGLDGRSRCIVAHPVNPPHVVPVVEVLGGRDTKPSVVTRTVDFLRVVGQTPVVLKRFTPGFLLNRMQAALVLEAMDLLARDVADVDAIDAVIRDGLGLRWALMGPFGVANTNADGGVREYFTRYGEGYLSLGQDLNRPRQLDAEFIERVGRATDAMEHAAPRPEIRQWRDLLVRKITQLKREVPHPGRTGDA